MIVVADKGGTEWSYSLGKGWDGPEPLRGLLEAIQIPARGDMPDPELNIVRETIRILGWPKLRVIRREGLPPDAEPDTIY